jgi:hypothetical protein
MNLWIQPIGDQQTGQSDNRNERPNDSAEFVEIRPMNSRTVEYEPASSPTLTLYQRALLGLLGLLASACGALAVTAWRAVGDLAAQEATRRSDLRGFHAQLVSEVRGLAEKSGMLTSADLCPVRFRFRMPDSQSPPGRPVQVSLQSGDNDWQLVSIGTNAAGIVEFGLVPPGEYRLTATMDDGYSLEHEFAVLPGVPVDRLVLCPNSSDNLHTALQVEWPESLRSCRLRAVCEVERDDVRAGEWTWAPRDRGRLLVMSAAADEAMRDNDDLAGTFQQTGELDTDLATTIPHRFCRISRIRVWHAGSDADPPTELATFAYRAGGGAAGTRPSDIALPAPCPRHERSPNVRTDAWVVRLPPEAEAALRRSLALEAVASNAHPSAPATGPAGSADPFARVIDFWGAGPSRPGPATDN